MRVTVADLDERRILAPARRLIEQLPVAAGGARGRLITPARAMQVAVPATATLLHDDPGGVLLWLPGRLQNHLNRQRGHWAPAARYRATWRDLTALTARPMAQRWNETSTYPKLVILTAHTWGRYDDDGLAAATKPIVDGLVDAGLIHSDAPEAQSGHRIERRQVINRKRRGVEVIIRCR